MQLLMGTEELPEPLLILARWVAHYPDPDTFLGKGPLQSFVACRGWRDADNSALAQSARATTDLARRLQLCQQMDALLVRRGFVVPLTDGRTHFLIKPWVKSYPFSPFCGWTWSEMVMDRR